MGFRLSFLLSLLILIGKINYIRVHLNFFFVTIELKILFSMFNIQFYILRLFKMVVKYQLTQNYLFFCFRFKHVRPGQSCEKSSYSFTGNISCCLCVKLIKTIASCVWTKFLIIHIIFL